MKPDERLSAIFRAELDERVRALGRDLLAFERAPAGAERIVSINALFRTAHSLKGAAGAMGLQLLELVCHRLEELFAAVREGRLDPDPDLFRVFFACADAIEEAGNVLGRGDDLENTALARVLESMDTAIAHTMHTAPAAVSSDPAPNPRQETAAFPHDEPMVRIAARRLDSLVVRSGELLTLSWRSDARLEELSALRASLRRCHAECRAAERQSPRAARAAAGTLAPAGREARDARATAVTVHADALRRLVEECDHLAAAFVEDRRALEQAVRPLDVEVRRARMLPFASACDGLDRIVRDVSMTESKPVELLIAGGELELDRSVIQYLRDPLIHLVRNAIDHGIEDNGKRQALGKPARGQITVSAARAGTRVEVCVADDGGGLDLGAIRERSALLGLPDAEGPDLIARIFLPGFSTRHGVTQVSGRGVGLDAVKTVAETMRGSVDVAHTPGRGTRFTLSLPVTLSSIRVLLMSAAGETFAIDAANIERLVLANSERFASVEGRTMLLLEGGPVPVAELGALLGMEAAPRAPRPSLPVALLRSGHRRLAVVVDEFLGEREVVIRSLGPRLEGLPHVSAGTILPTGKVALILDASDLVRSAIGGDRIALPQARETAERVPKKRVLLVDDSVTTRTLERSILEVAGYEVTAAADGDEAWRLLLQGGADVVVSDVDMPRMDGFALTEAIRGSSRFGDLPVILVTARESQNDKARGMAVGADAYLIKSAFDQKALLDALTRLL